MISPYVWLEILGYLLKYLMIEIRKLEEKDFCLGNIISKFIKYDKKYPVHPSGTVCVTLRNSFLTRFFSPSGDQGW